MLFIHRLRYWRSGSGAARNITYFVSYFSIRATANKKAILQTAYSLVLCQLLINRVPLLRVSRGGEADAGGTASSSLHKVRNSALFAD